MWSKLLAVAACVLLLSSCAQVSAQMDGAESSSGASAPRDDALLDVESFANLNGMISVLVRNNSDRVLSRADAVITVKNSSGTTIGTSQQQTYEGSCCSAVDVPPGELFGFYVWTPEADEVTDVSVDYRNLAWGRSPGGPSARVTPVKLVDNDLGAVVVADVSPQGGPIAAAVLQAVIDGPDGEFLAVISGTWFCFDPGVERRIYMQLYQDLPAKSTIEQVRAFPRPEGSTGGDANRGAACSPSDDAGAPRSSPSPSGDASQAPDANRPSSTGTGSGRS